MKFSTFFIEHAEFSENKTENTTKIGFIIISCLIFSMNYYNLLNFLYL